MNNLTLGSLFDGIGGFLLPAVKHGIKPIWASEIEPMPIAVTKQWFPEVRHLGDINKINGGEIEPVDIITASSPCQNLSVAGDRTGLEGSQSNLFFEFIRIVKEMREKYAKPRFIMWENVFGVYSSNKGNDFRIILEKI